MRRLHKIDLIDAQRQIIGEVQDPSPGSIEQYDSVYSRNGVVRLVFGFIHVRELATTVNAT